MTTTGDACKFALLFGSLLSYIFAVALNALLNIPSISPFNVTIADLAHKYDTGISPADATFSIWGLIYLWQAVLIIYCHTLLCRTAYGKCLYIDPGFVPPAFFAIYILNLIGNPAWIYVWLQEKILGALALLGFGFLALVACLGSSTIKLNACGADMDKKGVANDIWYTRIFVHNGIALYCAWAAVATLVNGVVFLHYNLLVAMDTSCWIALVGLNVILVLWFVLETYLLDRYLRYVFAHYISFTIALIGIFYKNYDAEITYTQYSTALLAFCAVLSVAKLIIMIVKGIKDPIHYPPSQGISYATLKEN